MRSYEAQVWLNLFTLNWKNRDCFVTWTTDDLRLIRFPHDPERRLTWLMEIHLVGYWVLDVDLEWMVALSRDVIYDVSTDGMGCVDVWAGATNDQLRPSIYRVPVLLHDVDLDFR